MARVRWAGETFLAGPFAAGPFAAGPFLAGPFLAGTVPPGLRAGRRGRIGGGLRGHAEQRLARHRRAPARTTPRGLPRLRSAPSRPDRRRAGAPATSYSQVPERERQLPGLSGHRPRIHLGHVAGQAALGRGLVPSRVVQRVDVPHDTDYGQDAEGSHGERHRSGPGVVRRVGSVRRSASRGASAGQPYGSGTPVADQAFTLAKVNGEWRIANALDFGFRMMTQADFTKVYRAQDLYFFDPTRVQDLVPDAVFVPTGTSPNSLVGNLGTALLDDPPPNGCRPRAARPRRPSPHFPPTPSSTTWRWTGPPPRSTSAAPP